MGGGVGSLAILGSLALSMGVGMIARRRCSFRAR
jgi:hypothetical protein